MFAESEVLVSKGGQSCLHEGTTLLCAIADSTIGNMCRKIRTGDITMQELHRISDRVKQMKMKKLCQAVAEKGVEEALELKLSEAKAFCRHRETLGLICDHVVNTPVKGIHMHVQCSYIYIVYTEYFEFVFYFIGLDDLKAQLKADYDNYPVNRLCVADGPSRFKCHLFQSAAPLDPIRMPFDFMSRLCQNDLFHRVWSNAVRKAAHRKQELTIQDIVDEIWRPAFKECDSTILGGLGDGSIKLQAVDSYFSHYANIETIKGHLYQLYKGVELCYGRTPPPRCPQWIHSAVGRVHHYWTLGQYAAAAQTVLELREKLGLTGDFHLMETIAEQVLYIGGI